MEDKEIKEETPKTLEDSEVEENKTKVSKYVEEKGSKIITFVRYEVGEKEKTPGKNRGYKERTN